MLQVRLEVDIKSLRRAESDLGTYSHCNVGGDCAYYCDNGPAAVGAWNLTALMDTEPGCQGLGRDSEVNEWWAANLLRLVTTPTTGFWFSMLKSGENHTWRQTSTESITKNCTDEYHFAAVERSGRDCFSTAGVIIGPHRDRQNPKWIWCYYGTVLGAIASRAPVLLSLTATTLLHVAGPRAHASFDRTGGWTTQHFGDVLAEAFQHCPRVNLS